MQSRTPDAGGGDASALSRVAVALVPLGCPKNDADAEYLLGLLERAGARVVQDPACADVILVNTCAFIQPAVEEALDTLLDCADLLDVAELPHGRAPVLICTGCLPARYGTELLEELPEVSGFVGPGAVDRIVEVVTRTLEGERLFVAPPPRFIGSADLPRCRIEPPWRASVKIADGCSHACSFCTIPSLRGGFRSRPPDDIAAEVESLLAGGVVEVCLVAQDTTSYGSDLGLDEGLARLLERLAPLVDPRGWLRVQYLHPDRLTEVAIEAILGIEPVPPYFDLPFQHASRSVLRAMRREGDAVSYAELVASIRSRCPDAALRATFILGFPGETEDDFAELLAFLDATEPDHVAAFTYWPEEGTRAAALPEQVSEPVARERHQELLDAARQIAQTRSERFLGSTLDVLVEEGEENDGPVGRTLRDAPEVDGTFYLASARQLAPGAIVPARVDGADANDLRGRAL